MLGRVGTVPSLQEQFLECAAQGDAVGIQRFLDGKNIEIDKGCETPVLQTKHRASAIFLATRGGHLDVVKLLVAADANVNVKVSDDRYSSTPLTEASLRGFDGIVKLLISYNADLDHILSFCRNKSSMPAQGTALIQALNNEHYSTAAILLKAGADHSKPMHTHNPSPECFRYEDECTALVLAARNAHSGIMTMLINRGADINHGGRYGYTPLMAAAAHGHHNIVKMLLKREVDVNSVTNLGATALTMAGKKGHSDIVDTLLAAGADICVVLSLSQLGLFYQRGLKAERTLSLAANYSTKEIVSKIVLHGAVSQNNYGLEWSQILDEIAEIYREGSEHERRRVEGGSFVYTECGLGTEADNRYYRAMQGDFINYWTSPAKELFTKEAVIFLAKILPEGDLLNKIMDDYNNGESKTKTTNPSTQRSQVSVSNNSNRLLSHEDMQQISVAKVAISHLQYELGALSLQLMKLPFYEQLFPVVNPDSHAESDVCKEGNRILQEGNSPESVYLHNRVVSQLGEILTTIVDKSKQSRIPSLLAMSATRILTDEGSLEGVVEAASKALKNSREIQDVGACDPSSFRQGVASQEFSAQEGLLDGNSL